ncbi:MAG: hypothetical protein KF894_10865 [Labilithrix sp.]|nr:hypothetical protein [Labilithrix sp.]
MNRTSAWVVVAALAAAAGVFALACGEDTEATEDPGADASAPGRDGGAGPGDDEEDEDAGPIDPPDDDDDDDGKDAGDSCIGKYAAPNIQNTGPCGTTRFGEPAAAFGPVNAADPDYTGTTLADGIYDAINAERGSALAGSWRETLVVKGNRFTRMRQVDTGGGGGLGAISYRAGTIEYGAGGSGQMVRFTYDCAQTGDAGVDAGADNLPSDAVVEADCSARIRYGASGIRLSLRRRASL